MKPLCYASKHMWAIDGPLVALLASFAMSLPASGQQFLIYTFLHF
jgi:hypothetical protein